MRLRLLNRLRWELPAVLLLAGSIANFAQEIASGKASANPTGPANPELKVAGAAGSSYRIGVGDVLHVSVWEEPQFTEAAVVRPDGMIVIPLVSDVGVAGPTPGTGDTSRT